MTQDAVAGAPGQGGAPGGGAAGGAVGFGGGPAIEPLVRDRKAFVLKELGISK